MNKVRCSDCLSASQRCKIWVIVNATRHPNVDEVLVSYLIHEEYPKARRKGAAGIQP